MSPHQPAVSGKDVVKALQRAGYEVVRVSGSHHRLVHRDDPTRCVTIPVHGSRTLKRGTLAAILKQSGLTAEQLMQLL